MRIFDLDAKYLWRRLTIIAYEDIGFGNVELCNAVSQLCRRAALRRKLGERKVGGFLAQALAESRKSRALCDAIAMMESCVIRSNYERRCFEPMDHELVDISCAEGSAMDTIAALRHICGYREVSHGSYRTIARPRPDLMLEVARRLLLTETETELFLSGQGISDSMNIPVPMIARMVRDCPGEERRTIIDSPSKNGILLSAVDAHTRAGKRAFAKLLGKNASLTRFFRIRQSVDPVEAIGAGIFIIEGALVDRCLLFHGDDEIRQTCERNVLEYARIHPDHQDNFLRKLKEAMPDLNQIREGELQ